MAQAEAKADDAAENMLLTGQAQGRLMQAHSLTAAEALLELFKRASNDRSELRDAAHKHRHRPGDGKPRLNDATNPPSLNLRGPGALPAVPTVGPPLGSVWTGRVRLNHLWRAQGPDGVVSTATPALVCGCQEASP
jgi:hypothetical protein